MKYILLIDTETTGLNKYLNEVLTFSGAILGDGKILETFDYRMCPQNTAKDVQGNYRYISDDALERNGINIDEALTWPAQQSVVAKFRRLLSKYVSGFKKNRFDKFYWMGYNCDFDIGFMDMLFQKFSLEPLVGKTNFIKLDPLHIIQRANYEEDFLSELKNFKLETVCEHYGIKIDAHKSISDALATLELYMKLEELNV